MDKYFRDFPKLSGGRMQWLDDSPASTILNDEFFGVLTQINTLTGEVIFTGFDPSLVSQININPGTGQIQLNGEPPSLQLIIQSDYGELTLEGYNPSIQLPVNLNTLTGEVDLTGYIPLTIIGTSIPTSTGKLEINGYIPDVIATSTAIKIIKKAGDYDTYKLSNKRIIRDDEEVFAIIQTFIKCLK